MHPPSVQPLPLKSGALQGALVVEYPFDHRFDSLHIVYDGVNGQLPNLDLFNTAVAIANGQMNIGADLQEMWDHNDSYEARLETILRGMVKQGFGYATGAHSSFMPYHVDAITLQTKGEGWEDEMALGRTVESLCRSLNNLLEHLHQSFFFYLLMQSRRFVSIGTYLPSAMLVAVNFTIMAIALWIRTGHYASVYPRAAPATTPPPPPPSSSSTEEKKPLVEQKPEVKESDVLERQLALPLTLVGGVHLLGLIPLYAFNKLSHQVSRSLTHSNKPGQYKLTRNQTVLHNGSLHIYPGRPRPPSKPRSPASPQIHNLLHKTNPAVPPNQILLAPHPRSLPLHPGNPQLLPLVHDRPPLRTPHLHQSSKPQP